MSALLYETAAPDLVLASASGSRRRLLGAAGLAFEALAAGVDESEVKESLKAEGAEPIQAAETLAELKAARIAAQRPGALVIGADQLLACEGRWYDKPADLAAAADQLLALAGHTHSLETAVCVVQNGTRLWHHNAVCRLTMRPFDRAFVDRYLAAVGPAALESVGGYQLEGLGVQLFSRIQGDFFEILGLPLLPLLGFLRDRGVVPR
ncbi:septum formation protein [Tistlia consotensis]|uniref:Nucleoside triphosphate pyrophosphatase n=1 Tax=Tistlia consotensis USBA 355 TaxID=560819 RepID=A0A1Y6BL23_9PROT|nr:Maf family protein [Tistlia consotensis]SMF08963.1 septum formation protein [Tistlia consotensis USBA 355]SNR34972.1 septum formation protein [Tistlia consotensis]